MIITNNEEALRIKCEAVTPDELDQLIQTLESELDYANKLGKGGIGLAAPQIGIAKHIAIIRLNSFNLNLVNCKLIKGFDPAIFKEEGCLSFPGRVEDTTRFQEVYLSNDLSQHKNLILTGLAAVVAQHELDHLNSVLFMDHKIKPIINKIKIGPNESCYCGSARKYKKCCGKNK
jgi:peptide deformylase